MESPMEESFLMSTRQAEKVLGAPEALSLETRTAFRRADTDGIALLQKIRQGHPDLPVVVTTAYVSMEPLMSVLDLGHSGYLVKPFDLNDLGARIDAVG